MQEIKDRLTTLEASVARVETALSEILEVVSRPCSYQREERDNFSAFVAWQKRGGYPPAGQGPMEVEDASDPE